MSYERKWVDMSYWGRAVHIIDVAWKLFVGSALVVGCPYACHDMIKHDREIARQNADPSYCESSKQVIDPTHSSGPLDFGKWCRNVAHQGSIEGVVVTCSCPEKK